MEPTFDIAVVIPTFRRHETLLAAIESVRAQSMVPAEIIIVDDHSGPDFKSVFESLDPDILVLRLPRNVGPAAARNEGAAIARSEFVAFLDSDDRWAPAKLERQSRHLAAHPECDAVHTGVMIKEGERLRQSTLMKPLELTLEHILRRREVITSSLVVRRQTFLDCGGFDPSIPSSEDYEFTIRLVAAGAKVQFLPEYLTILRRDRHHHVSADWVRVLRGQWLVALKHRRLIVRELGLAAFVAKVIAEAHHAAHKSRSWPARLLRMALTPFVSPAFEDPALNPAQECPQGNADH